MAKKAGGFNNEIAVAKRQAQLKYLTVFHSAFYDHFVVRRKKEVDVAHMSIRLNNSFAELHGAIEFHLFNTDDRNFSMRIKCAWDTEEVTALDMHSPFKLRTVDDRSEENMNVLIQAVLDYIYKPKE